MAYLGVTPQFTSRITYIYTLASTSTTITGADDYGKVMSYTAGFVTVYRNGVRLLETDYTSSSGSSIVLGAAPSIGDTIVVVADGVYGLLNSTPGLTDYVQSFSSAQKLLARSNLGLSNKNYIINGAMMVSQENGTTAGSTSGYYPVDMFGYSASHDGTISNAQVASVTPAGSPNRLRSTVTGTDTSIAAGQYATISVAVEGLRCADLMFGVSTAKTVVIKFGVKAPAGTYCVNIRNSAGNRSYVAEYTISAGEANTDVYKTVTIPGDTSGTWLKDTGIGLLISWMFACGSTYQTSAGAWTAGNYLGTSNQFNLLGVNSQVFELYDVGMYEATATSPAPDFVVPHYEEELRKCQRYYCQNHAATGSWTVASATTFYAGQIFPAPMRTTPTVSVVGGTFTNGAAVTGVAFKDVTAVSWENSGNAPYLGGILAVTTATIGAQTYDRFGELAANVIKINARM